MEHDLIARRTFEDLCIASVKHHPGTTARLLKLVERRRLEKIRKDSKDEISLVASVVSYVDTFPSDERRRLVDILEACHGTFKEGADYQDTSSNTAFQIGLLGGGLFVAGITMLASAPNVWLYLLTFLGILVLILGIQYGGEMRKMKVAAIRLAEICARVLDRLGA